MCATALFWLGAAWSGKGQTPEDSTPVIKTETRLVLVDAVVTDKKDKYVRDLTAKDFKLWEDGKPQTITSFAWSSDAQNPWHSEKRYLVVFFDDSTLAGLDQARGREAAVKFIQANGGDGLMMAVMKFTRALHIAQAFTNNTEKLTQAVRLQPAATREPGGGGPLSTSGLLLALRGVAKSLGSAPGRKSLVLFTGGFQILPGVRPDLEAFIGACNRSNVAVYPVDPRGVVETGDPRRPTSFVSSFMPQLTVPRGLGGPGNQSTVKGTGADNPNTVSSRSQRAPAEVKGAATDVLYEIAKRTGGFAICHTNDLNLGLTKVASEQTEYYLLGYTPADSQEGSCHELKVKVVRSGTAVRARTGYCNVRLRDPLKGSAEGKDLEARVAGREAGNVAASLRLPFFYTAPQTARVNLTMELPGSAMAFEKVKGKFHGSINVLGVAYAGDGTVAARFSDTVKQDLDDKDQVDAFTHQPFHYRNEFEIAPGEYNFKLAFTTGRETFGRIEAPLVIEPFDGSTLALSGLVLSNEFHHAAEQPMAGGGALSDSRTPLVVGGMEIVPSGGNRFKATSQTAIYAEVYEPLLSGEKPPRIEMRYQILERTTGVQKFNSGPVVVPTKDAVNNTVPVALTLMLTGLAPGSYTVRMQARNSLGGESAIRQAGFEVE
jgi:VWFA-related protein